MPVYIIRNLIPDIIFGNDFLVEYGVVMDYTSHEIFLGKSRRIRVTWHGSSNQAADSLSRNPDIKPESDKGIPEREVPKTRTRKGNSPVLIAMERDSSELDLELIKKWQDDDYPCKRMKDWIRKRSTHPLGVPKDFKMNYKNFRLEKDILMYTSHLSDLAPVPVVPRFRADVILQKFHDNPEAGHPGEEETYSSIRSRFFWVHMRQDVKHYVQTCKICACTKPSNRKASNSTRGRRPNQPWEVLAADLMGPYPRTARGKTCIFVVTDLFTRWVEAFPIPEATTDRLLSLLKTEVFSRYGYPRCLITDNGTQFTSNKWSEALDRWGIEHWTTPIYHPQANPTERRNQDLKKLLRIHLMVQEHKKWDQHLHEALFSMRQRVNRVTGYSPAELFLGRPLRRTGDWGIMPSDEKVSESTTSWHLKNQQQIQKMQNEAEKRARKEAEALDCDENMDLEPGQPVLRRNHALSNKLQGFHAGLAPKWLGPFEVDRKLGKGVYLLKTDPPTKVHASELKVLPQPLRAPRTDLDSQQTDISTGKEDCKYNLRPRIKKTKT